MFRLFHFIILVLATAACGPGARKRGSAPPKPVLTPRCPQGPAEGKPVEASVTPQDLALAPKLVLSQVEFAQVPGWNDDQVGEALPALRKSCRRLMKKRDSSSVGRDDSAGYVRDWREICALAKKVDAGNEVASRAFFEDNFHPHLAMNNDEPEGRFTGYYEASLQGSLKRKGRYQTPLYKRPDDLVMVNMRNFTSKPGRRRIAGRVVRGMLKPYENRKQIRNGSLRGKGLELVWIDDPVDGFFTQIQGSGLVQLSDGSQMRIGYAGQNGHSYTAIGRELVRDGHITKAEMSMQAIRTWLSANPKGANEMMDRNQAYVFFTKLDGNGPVGSQNVELTAERSAAVDREFIAQTVPLFIDTTIVAEDGVTEERFQSLVIAQDSGGAIRGPVRADIFWGAGARATAIAGRLKSRGRYYLLLPKALSGR